MSITPEQVDLWRAERSEHQRLEFKAAKNHFDTEKLYEYCVAIANEGGGHLILGVADKPPRHVVGSAAIQDPIGMTQRLFTKLGFRVDIEVVRHLDGRVVVFDIPSRPTGSAFNLVGVGG